MSDPSTIHDLSGWRRIVLWPLAFLVQIWGRTLRFEISESERAAFEKKDTPIAFVLWHNRLFLTPEFYRRYRGKRPIHALISASKDGAWLSAFFSLLGMRAARGSSSRLGREAATALVEALRAGNDVGITPDGPRGPCYDFKPGALVVTRTTATTILIIGGEFSSAWRLGSWDKFYLPRPFSRVKVRCELVAAGELTDRDAAIQRLSSRLREMNPD